MANHWLVSRIGMELGFTSSEISMITSKQLLIPEGALGYWQENDDTSVAAVGYPLLPTVETLTSALRKTGREQLSLR